LGVIEKVLVVVTSFSTEVVPKSLNFSPAPPVPTQILFPLIAIVETSPPYKPLLHASHCENNWQAKKNKNKLI
jgi:hypothetical protein